MKLYKLIPSFLISVSKYVDTSYTQFEGAKDLSDHPEAPFSLAEFVFSLSGAYFNKFLHVTFQGCRHLTLLLDQDRLTRIGSGVFRPDIVLSSIDVEQVKLLQIQKIVFLTFANFTLIFIQFFRFITWI